MTDTNKAATDIVTTAKRVASFASRLLRNAKMIQEALDEADDGHSFLNSSKLDEAVADNRKIFEALK